MVVKNPPANVGNIRDVGSIPESGRSLGGGHSNPVQYSCLENHMDRRDWQSRVHRVARSQTRLKQFSTQAQRRAAWSNSKFGPGVRNEAGQRLTEFCQENAWSQQTPSSNNTREDYTWTSPDGQYQNQIDYILCNQRWRSSIQSAKTRPGADCGSDHELLIAKF